MTTIINEHAINQRNKENRTVLYLADLEPNITDIDIKNFLGDFKNQAAHIEIKYPKSSPFIAAIIVFKDHESAKKVKNELNMRKLRNRSCRIMWDDKEGIKNISYHTENNNIFVKNIPLEVTPREVFEVFSEFGEITSVKITENKDGSHNGYGYISYEDSKFAIEAINKCNLKPIFKKHPDFYVEVEFFRRQNQRGNSNYNPLSKADTSKILEANATIFVKNLPDKTLESEIKPIFEKYGTISYLKPNFVDNQYIKTFILSYDNEGSATKAETELNNTEFKGVKIIVEKLSYISSSQSVKSGKPNSMTPINRNCALYVKNIPDYANEENLREVFSQYGTVKNVIILKQNYMHQEGGQYKEKEASTGVGQVHYDTQEEAFLAKEKLNGKFLPGFETWKLPLFVDIYVSAKERHLKNNEMMGGYYNPMMGGMMNPMMMQMNMMNMQGMPMNNSYYNQQMKGGNNPYYNQQKYGQGQNYGYKEKQGNNVVDSMNNLKISTNESSFIKVNNDVLKSLQDTTQKKEYLGELIFNNINNHHLTVKEKISIDEVGKITGMILGIEDINEVLLPCSSYNELTLRIEEALKLIRAGN